jgi:hypothetical protein
MKGAVVMTPSTITIEEFRPFLKNSLIGFCRVRMPNGLVFHDVSVHRQGDAVWASPSAKAQIGRDGTHIKKDGKPQYSPVVSFASKEVRDKFSDAILGALRASHPEALAP